MDDPIVKAVRENREKHAARFNYNLEKIFNDLKNKEIKSGIKVVSRPPKLFLKKTA